MPHFPPWPLTFSGASARFSAEGRLWRLSLLVAFCCLIVSIALASDQPTAVQISVLDEKNQPVAGAMISVTLGDLQVTTAETDAAGKANVILPSTGTYLLTISKTGYLSTGTSVDAT